MTRITLPIASLATLLICAFSAVPLHAQSRVFVAAQGSDSNPCTFAAPCRTFNRAASAVAAGGEIDVLDPAEYGSLSITKALSVQGHGFAGLSPAAAASAGIVVQVGPTDKVNLKGLIIEGNNFGAVGLLFNTGGSLVLKNSVVRNWRGAGIGIQPTDTTPLGSPDIAHDIVISNTLVEHNGDHGIFVQAAHGVTPAILTLNVLLNRVEIYDNVHQGFGIYSNFGGFIRATAVDTVSARNSTNFFALGTSCNAGVTATLELVRVTAFASTSPNEVFAQDKAEITVGQSSLRGNTFPWAVSTCGAIYSYGDNHVRFTDPPSGNVGTK